MEDEYELKAVKEGYKIYPNKIINIILNVKNYHT